MRKTKTLFALLAILLFLVGCGEEVIIEENDTEFISGVSDASVAYCRLMGYEMKLEGSSIYCIFPDGNKCINWRFYEGVCGQEWSYCEQNGYKLESRDDGKDTFSTIYSMCLDKNSLEEIGLVVDLLELKQQVSGGLSR
jgi:putative hemolysin